MFKLNIFKNSFLITMIKICKKNQRSLCGDIKCITCFERSFATEYMAKNWSSKNKALPYEIMKKSTILYWFICETCNHEYETSPSTISRKNNIDRCSYCAPNSRDLCNDENCDKCYNKSFASHPRAIHWHSDNILKPRQVTKRSGKSYKFKCENCPHSFEKSLHSITNVNKDPWCPYCCKPPQKLCEDNNCDQCFNNSFASHYRSKYWSSKNTKTPRQVFKGTRYKYILICDEKHEFEMNMNNITKKDPHWCPQCINKTETILYEWLKSEYTNIKKEFSFDWCKNDKTNCKYRFDFVLDNFNIIIELDGQQHFEQVGNWKPLKNTHEKDIYKMKCANSNGFTIIRISQSDVYYNRLDWKNILKTHIKQYIAPEYVYISSNDLYNNFFN